MPLFKSYLLTFLLMVALAFTVLGCGSDDTDGDVTDGDTTDGDTTDGDVIDGDVTDGDVTDGDVTDGDVTDGDVTDGDVTDGDVTDGDVTDGDVTDGDVTDGDITDGDVTDGDVTDGDVTDGDVTDGDVTDGDVTDGDVTDGDVTDGDEDGDPDPEIEIEPDEPPSQRDIGDPCNSGADCDTTECLTTVTFQALSGLTDPEVPGGLCTSFEPTVCDAREDSQRIDGSVFGGPYGTFNLCLPVCDTDADCRMAEGYRCFDPATAVAAGCLSEAEANERLGTQPYCLPGDLVDALYDTGVCQFADGDVDAPPDGDVPDGDADPDPEPEIEVELGEPLGGPCSNGDDCAPDGCLTTQEASIVFGEVILIGGGYCTTLEGDECLAMGGQSWPMSVGFYFCMAMCDSDTDCREADDQSCFDPAIFVSECGLQPSVVAALYGTESVCIPNDIKDRMMRDMGCGMADGDADEPTDGDSETEPGNIGAPCESPGDCVSDVCITTDLLQVLGLTGSEAINGYCSTDNAMICTPQIDGIMISLEQEGNSAFCFKPCQSDTDCRTEDNNVCLDPQVYVNLGQITQELADSRFGDNKICTPEDLIPLLLAE